MSYTAPPEVKKATYEIAFDITKSCDLSPGPRKWPEVKKKDTL